MENKNQIQEELMQISPVIAAGNNGNVYSVSPFYFDNLATEVIEKIKNGVEPVYFLSDTNPYSVPDGYFSNFAETVLGKIKVGTEHANEVFEEMEEISPLLNSISKKPVFDVPADYFDQIKAPAFEVPKTEAKVVSIKSAPRRIMRYAVAAVVATILAVGAFLFTGKDAGVQQAQNNISGMEMKNLSEQEIIEFLNKNTMSFEASATNVKERESAIKNAVKEVSDKEIQQFLQENAISDEI